MRLFKPFFALILGVFLLFPLAPLHASDTLTETQKREIESLVRSYLIENPDILEEMFIALEARRATEADMAMAESLGEHRLSLFDGEKAQVMGNPDGAITLVEFFDYNCGICRTEFRVLQDLVDANPDLRVLMWEWPVVRPPQSIDAARISLAVRAIVGQEQWMDFHQAVMESRQIADGDNLFRIASDMGLSREQVEEKMDDESVLAHLEIAGTVGDSMGFRGTPTFIIGNSVIAGGGQLERLQGLIDDERARQN